MRAYFIIYEQDGRTGNDFTSGKLHPYKWLVESRSKYPDSYIAIKDFSEIEVRPNEFNLYDSLIGIDVDNSKANEKLPITEVTGKQIEGEVVENKQIPESEDILGIEIADNKAETKPVIAKKQAKRKGSNGSRKPSKGSDRKYNRSNK